MRRHDLAAALAIATAAFAACIPDVVPTEAPPTGSSSGSTSSSSGAGGAGTTTSASSSSASASSGSSTASSASSSGAGGACPAPAAGCGNTEWAHWKPLDKHTYQLAGATVLDKTTGLTWTYDVGSMLNHDAAVSYCQGLSTGGCTDWRLPARVELASLVDYTSNATALWDPVFDPGPGSFYWTSTPYPDMSGYFWEVNFTSGGVNFAGDTLKGQVRCVR